MSADEKLTALKIQLGSANRTLPNICSSKSKIKNTEKTDRTFSHSLKCGQF
ncbi:conserved hypothetical protein [Aggregatibacter segnis ATCC 33393]|uniref:Uncharacterized protein n=1 Tax=Aggregatibacter segnis ATCC 33393 TaxID=888057 RepID=E6L084_9PAST|nr:conserved hypothetical protein [Aggregatibacter segnis ATCC 33393]